MRAIAPRFAQIGDDIDTALTQLKAGILREGRCWGFDEPGKQFEKGYPQGNEPGGVGYTLDQLGKLAQLLHSVGTQIASNANSIDRQDEHNARQLRERSV